jgi:sulfur-carrier protein
VRTIGALRDCLALREPKLALPLRAVRFARNEEFVDEGQALDDGDVVAVIPPVAGG